MEGAVNHGGDVYAIARRLGIGENEVVDFSASINPLGMPDVSRRAILDAIRLSGNYPDRGCGVFIEALSSRFGIMPENTIAGNGSTELIYLIPRALGPRSVLIAAPTFSEYERASLAAGAKVSLLRLRRKNGFRVRPEDFIPAMKGMDLAFLCNPNNPTGDVLEKEAVVEIAENAIKSKCVLVVDEAFMDFAPEESVLGTSDNPYLVVLRSMTKFYGMAGLRLGYGYFPGRLAERIRKYKEPWSVNTLAERAGAIALTDDDFERKSLELIAGEKRYMEGQLDRLGLKYYPSGANFYLLETRKARDIASGLLERRLAVRDCSDFKGLRSGFIRVAVKSRKDNAMLIRGLSDILGDGKKWRF
jgi:threonine-phosphate decarboxylase